MINNIEYTEIKKYIDDIILDKIIYLSKIEYENFYGGVQEIPSNNNNISNEEKSNIIKISKKIAIAFSNFIGYNNIDAGIIESIDKYSYIINQNLFYINITSFFTPILVLVCISIIGLINLNTQYQNIEKMYHAFIIIGLCFGSLIYLGNTNNIDNILKIPSLFQSIFTLTFNNISGIHDMFSHFKGGEIQDIYSSNFKGGSVSNNNLLSYINNIIFNFLQNSGILSVINNIKEFINRSLNDKNYNEEFNIDPTLKDKMLDIIKKNIKGENNSYYFDELSGKIVYFGGTNFKKITTVLSVNPNSNIKKVIMITEKDKSIHYLINDNTKIDTNAITLIEGKPIHTGLVFAYISQEINYKKELEKNKYVYYYDDNGNIKIHLKNVDGSAGKEISTFTRAIISQKNNKELEALEYIRESCKEIFDVDNGLSNNVCAKHFYSILGKAGLSMIKNLKSEIDKNLKIEELLLSANTGIQYELLKNLDWKINKKSNILELVDVDQWLEINKNLNSNYKEYLNGHKNIKNLLNNIVKKINSEPLVIYNKLNNKSDNKSNVIKKRLNKKQIQNLKGIYNVQNFVLNYPFKLNKDNEYQIGGDSIQIGIYEEKYNIIKRQLASFNQKLSKITEEQIKKKIRDINELKEKLSIIYDKIINYIKIIKENKIFILNKKILNIEDIDKIIDDYNYNSNKYNKKLITLSNAFQKIKMVISDIDSKNKNKNYIISI